MWIHATGRMLAALCAAALVAACGGGGGGGEASAGGDGGGGGTAGSDLVFSPTSIRMDFVEGGQDPDIIGRPMTWISATFPGGGPQGEVYVRVMDEKPVVEEIAFSHSDSEGSHWRVVFDPFLPVGEHKGTLDVLVCEAPECPSDRRSWNASLPYRVKVTPGIVLSAFVNGRRVEDRVVKARHGDVLSISASVPVSWSNAWTSGAHAVDHVSTTSTWRAIAEYSVSTPGDTGTFAMEARSRELGARATVTFAIRE